MASCGLQLARGPTLAPRRAAVRRSAAAVTTGRLGAPLRLACPAVRLESVSRKLAVSGFVRSAASAEPSTETASTSDVEVPVVDSLSYSQQYDEVFSKPLVTNKAIAKPDKDAQASQPGSIKVFASDVHAVGKRPLWFNRQWDNTDKTYLAFIAGMHIVALAAPFCFSWSMVALFAAGYFVTGCLGITLSYHRQLSHKSFRTPKWLEYALAYCGVLAVQGDPLEWVSSHRYHHLHCDTPLDPHSPFEGFWWSHAGWLLDHEAVEARVSDRSNANDMHKQWFYRFLEKTYVWHIVASFAALFAIGGWPAVVWGGALRTIWVYHITWFVNSASHVWGSQDYNTGDLSRNNWWVGILAFGEGWHNNHHAFEFSARHGLKWWQVDMTWMIISGLKAVGLASHVKLPSEAQKARLAFN